MNKVLVKALIAIGGLLLLAALIGGSIIGYKAYEESKVKPLPKCYDNSVIEQVINIQKENDPGYPRISDFVASTELVNIRTLSYDENIGKYECSADFIVHFSTPVDVFGRRPSKITMNEPYRYNSKTCYDINYSIERRESEPAIIAQYCEGTSLYDTGSQYKLTDPLY